MKGDVFDDICKQRQNGSNYQEIAQVMGLHPTTPYTVINAVNKVGYEIAKSLLVDRCFQTHTYTADKLAEVTEDIVSQEMTLWDAVFAFKIQLERLRQLVNLRNKQGCKLTGALILSKFKWAGKLGGINERQAQDKDNQNLSSNVINTNHSKTYVPRKIVKAEIKSLEDQPRRIGKATVAPRAYSGRKIMRNKSILAASKQQQRIKQRIEETKLSLEPLDPSLTNVENSEVNESPRRNKDAVLVKARSASDFLDAQGNCIIKKGRPPYVDPLSEGFNKMPEAVKRYSITRNGQDCELVKAFSECSIGKELTTMTRFKICQSLRSKFSNVPKERVFRACGIAPYREKELLVASTKPDRYAEVKPLIVKIFEDYNGRAGRITIATMLRKHGVYICDQTVRKLMLEMGLKAITPKGKHYNSYKGESSLCPNLLERNFEATYQGEKLVTDVTMVNCADKNLYISACKDLFTKEVTISLSDSPTTEFVIDSVMPHLRILKEGKPCLVHSDQGYQYQSGLYQQTLKQFSMVTQSMSRKGNCADNGACESFFAHFKTIACFNSKASFEINSKKALEAVDFYNTRRVQTRLGGIPPTLFRIKHNGVSPSLK